MIRLQLSIALDYRVQSSLADFIFCIQPARTPAQTVLAERIRLLHTAPDGHAREPEWRMQLDPLHGSRLLRVRATTGRLTVSANATVDIRHHRCPSDAVTEAPIDRWPADVLPFVMPSRYCESDRLLARAFAEFGSTPRGHARVVAIRDWVRQRIRYQPSASTPQTTACDTLAAGAGVCRDYAHLMIAMCRAMNLPARFVSGTDYGTDPSFGPPDFHAYVEVWLDDGWYLFDPTGIGIPMGYARIGTGRDAADVAFATIFGAVSSTSPVVRTVAIHDPVAGIALPVRTDEALCTDHRGRRLGQNGDPAAAIGPTHLPFPSHGHRPITIPREPISNTFPA